MNKSDTCDNKLKLGNKSIVKAWFSFVFFMLCGMTALSVVFLPENTVALITHSPFCRIVVAALLLGNFFSFSITVLDYKIQAKLNKFGTATITWILIFWVVIPTIILAMGFDLIR